MPQHANSLNTTFGGQMMAWAEDLAAISATRLSRLDMVTARVDAMHFKAPSFVGEVITAQSQVCAGAGRGGDGRLWAPRAARGVLGDGWCVSRGRARGARCFVAVDSAR